MQTAAHQLAQQFAGRRTVCGFGRPVARRPLAQPVPQRGIRVVSQASKDGQLGEQDASSSPSGPSGQPGDEEVEKLMTEVWTDFKKNMKQGGMLTREEERALERIEPQDLADGDKAFRKMAEEMMGPILASIGVDEDPYQFFIDLLKLATALQLVSIGVAFYSAELGAHLNTGEAFRIASGLGLGYLTRPFIKVELLLGPAYNALLSLVLPSAVYEVGSSGPDELSRTLNTMGVSLAAVFILPQVFAGWSQQDAVQLAVPLTMGWALFDVAYGAALLVKLRVL